MSNLFCNFAPLLKFDGMKKYAWQFIIALIVAIILLTILSPLVKIIGYVVGSIAVACLLMWGANVLANKIKERKNKR